MSQWPLPLTPPSSFGGVRPLTRRSRLPPRVPRTCNTPPARTWVPRDPLSTMWQGALLLEGPGGPLNWRSLGSPWTWLTEGLIRGPSKWPSLGSPWTWRTEGLSGGPMTTNATAETARGVASPKIMLVLVVLKMLQGPLSPLNMGGVRWRSLTPSRGSPPPASTWPSTNSRSSRIDSSSCRRRSSPRERWSLSPSSRSWRSRQNS
mmetsp:Transcript_19345/g.30252  ORF Transcript_19345/g.30252 Transcript_19345/m.30252 type:complete len:205 (+) Transcript_19345:57-671(+)